LDHGYFDDATQLARDALAVKDDFHDDAIHNVVAFVVDHCQMHAHGQRQVPLGDGTMRELPVLTRLQPVNDMWLEYKSFFDEQLRPFIQILAHDGPLHRTNVEGSHQSGGYKGSLYNLLIDFKDDGDPSWEPMHAVVASDPMTVAEYGEEEGLLDETKGWISLKKYLSNDNRIEPTLQTWRGGKQFLGETSFKLIA
jgi:hypothetical protein